MKRIAERMVEIGDDAGELLRRIAEFGLEVKQTRSATTRKDYYDLSVADWNTYAAPLHPNNDASGPASTSCGSTTPPDAQVESVPQVLP